MGGGLLRSGGGVSGCLCLGGEGRGGGVRLASQLMRVEAVAMLRGLRRVWCAMCWFGGCLGAGYARLGIAPWWWFGGSSRRRWEWVLVWWWPRARARGRKNDVGVWCRAGLASQCHHGRPQASF